MDGIDEPCDLLTTSCMRSMRDLTSGGLPPAAAGAVGLGAEEAGSVPIDASLLNVDELFSSILLINDSSLFR